MGLKVPTRDEILANQNKQKDLWVARNVKAVLERLQYMFEGSLGFDYTGSRFTGRREENLEDCTLLALRNLAPDFYFRKIRGTCLSTIEWRDRPFPKEKPWWKIW